MSGVWIPLAASNPSNPEKNPSSWQPKKNVFEVVETCWNSLLGGRQEVKIHGFFPVFPRWVHQLACQFQELGRARVVATARLRHRSQKRTPAWNKNWDSSFKKYWNGNYHQTWRFTFRKSAEIITKTGVFLAKQIGNHHQTLWFYFTTLWKCWIQHQNP